MRLATALSTLLPARHQWPAPRPHCRSPDALALQRLRVGRGRLPDRHHPPRLSAGAQPSVDDRSPDPLVTAADHRHSAGHGQRPRGSGPIYSDLHRRGTVLHPGRELQLRPYRFALVLHRWRHPSPDLKTAAQRALPLRLSVEIQALLPSGLRHCS
ncbi:MAG: hypothetical protein ACJAWL_001948 [Motiliproteus sp.]|jgi:hypothetical protein